jgi:hypothetical protein
MGQFDDTLRAAEAKRKAINERIKKSNEELDATGRHLFTTEAGKQLLDLLEEMYYKGPLVGATTEETYFKLGSREVVTFLQSLHPKEK